MSESWRIELFGVLRLTRGSESCERFRTQKTASLLGFLAYHHPRSHPRDLLVELLWPDDEVESGRHKLTVALSSLRQQLEPPGVPPASVLSTGRLAVGLVPGSLTTDVAEFEAALRAASAAGDPGGRARWLSRAAELYRGDLLPGCYEDWVTSEQRRLKEACILALRQLASAHEELGEPHRALAPLRRAADLDPLQEETQRDLMRACAAAGEPAAALRHYHELVRLLDAELGVTPSAATRNLARQIENGEPMPATPGAPARAPVAPPPSAASSPPASSPLEPVGGAVPPGSPFYVSRDSDAEFHAAIARRDSIVLVKGARQAGKTSLLARGLRQAREAGARVVLTPFQSLNAAHLESAEALLRCLAEAFADQLDIAVQPAAVWEPHRGPNPNFVRYLRREVLARTDETVVWGLDDLDVLFACPFGSEILALFRSWHNERALDPAGPWSRLTQLIGYSAEAHLFITDLNQSPFNVGTRLTLDDFTQAQVSDLNGRHGGPLKGPAEVARFYALVGGHPYLCRRGLHELALRAGGIGPFETRAADPDWIYGDHLRRVLDSLSAAPELLEAGRAVLRGGSPDAGSFFRLRSAGVLAGDSEEVARFRCRLYTAYLERVLK